MQTDSSRRSSGIDLAGAIARPPHADWRVVLVAIALLCASAMLSGCGSVPERYVEADAATYRAIAPEYADLLECDAASTPLEREAGLATLAAWRARLLAAGVDAQSLPVLGGSATAGE